MSEAMRWRLQGLGVAALMFTFTAVNGIFGMEDLIHLLRGFTESRPVITSSHYLGTMLLLTPMGFSFGLLGLFLKKATPEEQKKVAANPSRKGYWYLYFIAGSIVAAFAAPIVQYIVVAAMASNRGYVSCPTPNGERHQPDRWARSLAQCPGDGADPNE